MPSTLSFASSSSFRDILLAKNLVPYSVSGVYTPPASNINTEVSLNNFSVVDSPNDLIANDPFAQLLYPLNEYGPNGGYDLNINFNGPPLPVNSNQGEYAPTDTALDLVNEFFIDASYVNNYYGPVGGFNDMYGVTTQILGQPIHQPYLPTNFVASSYSPYEILLSTNPTGDNGSLSQDSYLARLGATYLNELFQDRINRQIFINTVGQVNLESLSDPFEASLIISGQEPLVYRNWKITSPEDPITAAADLITRLGGAYWPVSLIPGDYFSDNTRNGQTQQTSTALNVVNQLTGGFLGPILNIKRNPSEIFLANTGNGQRSVLFRNLNYNRYQPSYDKNFGGLLGIGQAIVSLINPDNGTLVGGYYVGSRNSEPSTITSPPNQVPVNAFGQQEDVPVYGPSELGILYEGNQDTLNFGLAAKSLSDGGGIDGQFVWTSPKYKANAGFKATPGGGSGSADPEYNLISSNYTRDESTNFTFKKTSILDQTQRLVDSADNVQGITRLKHVGNAINQVSKVFHDGYKEMTKGSQVVSYTDQTTGGEAGIEYCRVFTKDTPYYTYNDLQKVDGITTSGRQYAGSVFDNTFNLNISPTRNPGSTNIIADGPNGIGGYAKKYMFSIENLAWRTSSKQGYTYDELPVCEKGPNGGRVMWFPPYDIKFNDNSNANWTETSFLGRPEPIYTYKDTRRMGTLSWKIIVDHPSVMNVLVEKQLKGQNKERINSIIDSFFAGCVKYDIYELAKKFNTVPTKDLYTYQQILNNPNLDKETAKTVIESAVGAASVGTDASAGYSAPQTNPEPSCDLDSKYNNFGFYFDNDIPGPSNRTNPIPNSTYKADYDNYTYSMNQDQYVAISSKTFSPPSTNLNVKQFFENVVIDNFNYINTGFVEDAFKILSEKTGIIKVSLRAAASAPANKTYNVTLSKRRANSVIEYFKTTKLGKFITEDKTLTFPNIDTLGEDDTATPKSSKNGFGGAINCTEDIKDKNGKVTKDSQWYSVSAMACRRVVITDITVTAIPQDKPVVPVEKPIIDQKTTTTSTEQKPKPVPTSRTEKTIKEGISKLILRKLLSECDYFDVVKKEVPMLYDSIQEKIKYFNPAFHSMTPEGLNSRLTFLNQCVRPGESIPVIGDKGQIVANDALNTSFGAPPVLVLRIGDFYNCKIIPKAVSFSYEPLVFDMNPEGIGIQPMIANVTMNFDMIGGMGLEKPVEQLQNALSFNYYANTEIYDERATATDDSWKKLDKQYFQSLIDEQPSQTTVDNQETNPAGETIGQIQTTINGASGQTGDITYAKIMDSLLDVTKDYYTNIINQAESMTKSYNDGIWQLISKERQYPDGLFNFNTTNLPVPATVKIFGKSVFESRIDDLFTETINDVDNDTNFIILGLIADNFNDSTLRSVKTNLKKYLTDYQADFSLGVNSIINNVVQQQVDMVQVFRKINFVTTLSDGIFVDSKSKIYNISGTTETDSSSFPIPANTYEELWRDYEKVSTDFQTFNQFLIDEGVIYNDYDSPGDFNPFTTEISDITDKRFFMIMAQVFNNSDKFNTFKSTIVTNELDKSTPNLSRKFNKIVNNFRDKVKNELDAEEKYYKTLKKSEKYRNYLVVENLYKKGKIRKFNYTTEPSSTNDQQIKNLTLLYNGNNGGDKTTWTDKTKFN
jgi:hypothetical protein